MKQKENELFKYYSCEAYNLDALANGYLWFSNPQNLNDPFDCNFEGYRNSSAFSPLGTEFIHNMYEKFDSFGICSFTQCSENQHFWSLYSANYSGFCLVFDKDKLEIKLNSFGIITDKVDYQALPLDQKIIDETNSNVSPEYCHTLEQQLRKIAFIKKAEVWGYEEEIRSFLGLICIDKMKTGENNIERGHNGYKVPIKDIKALKNIILGHNISPENKALIVNLVQHNYPEIKLLQLELDHESWLLKVVDMIN